MKQQFARFAGHCLLVLTTFVWPYSAKCDEPVGDEPRKSTGGVVDVRSGDLKESGQKQRFQSMVSQSEEYDIQTDSSPVRMLKLHDRPLMRFNNPVSGVPDGIIAMWKDGPRPAVIAQVFQLADGQWLHEAQSMAATPLTMRNRKTGATPWQPKTPGLKWIELPDVAVESRSAIRRLSQMRGIASGFSAIDQFQLRAGDTKRSTYKLRLLRTPLYRYSDAKTQVIDAAVFAFVHGTDPEMFLLLEAFEENEITSWRYALAPMTCWSITAKYKDTVVWSVKERLGISTPTGDYHVWGHQPVNK